MATTYELISSTTVGAGGVASIDFTSIPQTFTDLAFRYSMRGNLANNATYIVVEFNGTAANRQGRVFGSNGTSTFVSAYGSDIFSICNGTTSTNPYYNTGEFNLLNYTSNTQKGMHFDSYVENNDTASQIQLFVGLRSGTGAVNRVTFYAADASFGKNHLFLEYSYIALYGIKSS